MKTIHWILIALGALTIGVVATILITKKTSKKKEEEVVDDIVRRMTFGVDYVPYRDTGDYCQMEDGSDGTWQGTGGSGGYCVGKK